MNSDRKQYDLEERTEKFARRVRSFVKILKKSISNIEDGKQLVRSSGSVGANYIEANEALTQSRRLSSLPQVQGSRRGAIVGYAPRRLTPKMR